MPPWEKYQSQGEGPWSKYRDVPAEVPQAKGPRTALDYGESLITNLPTKDWTQDVVRGAPAAGGGMVGALAGAAAGTAAFPGVGTVIGGILGAGLGGITGESLRQATAQGTAVAFPEAQYPIQSPKQVLRDVGIQGATNAIGEGVGQGIGLGLNAIRPALNRGGATVLKVAANVPEKSGEFALGELTRLGKAPSDEAVSQAYDAFHTASGTVSRKEAIARSGDPFDTVSRAMGTMRDAFNNLRNGTLTVQQAVEASQAGRIISDMKSRGVEMAQQVAEQASHLKGQFDDFIERGIGPRMGSMEVPIAQEITKETTPIASKIVPKSDIFQSATTLVPDRVNIPTTGYSDILPDIRGVVDVVKKARANSMAPTSLMTDAERGLYSRFQTQIDSAAEHNIPVQSLLTSAETSAPVSGFAERSVLKPGDPIYSGRNRYEFGGTIEKTSYKPGEIIMGDVPIQIPAQPGFPEWQAARQAAFENNVANDFSHALPRNVNGSPNVLRTWSAIGGGATTGAGIGAMAAGPAGALLGGGVGAVVGGLGVSPLAYGTAIRMAGQIGRVAPTVYRVGSSAVQGAAGSELQQAYLSNRRIPIPDPAMSVIGGVRPAIP